MLSAACLSVEPRACAVSPLLAPPIYTPHRFLPPKLSLSLPSCTSARARRRRRRRRAAAALSHRRCANRAILLVFLPPTLRHLHCTRRFNIARVVVTFPASQVEPAAGPGAAPLAFGVSPGAASLPTQALHVHGLEHGGWPDSRTGHRTEAPAVVDTSSSAGQGSAWYAGVERGRHSEVAAVCSAERGEGHLGMGGRRGQFDPGRRVRGFCAGTRHARHSRGDQMGGGKRGGSEAAARRACRLERRQTGAVSTRRGCGAAAGLAGRAVRSKLGAALAERRHPQRHHKQRVDDVLHSRRCICRGTGQAGHTA